MKLIDTNSKLFQQLDQLEVFLRTRILSNPVGAALWIVISGLIGFSLTFFPPVQIGWICAMAFLVPYTGFCLLMMWVSITANKLKKGAHHD